MSALSQSTIKNCVGGGGGTYLPRRVGTGIPYTREHNDRSFYLKLVAAMGRYIYGVYLFMG